MDTTNIILTSTVIATFLASTINAVVGHYAKQRDFKNDYYKDIIKRRLKAYKQVNALVVKLKTAILEEDNKPYHFLFSDEEGKLTDYLKSYADIYPHQLLISETLFEKLRELQDIMFGYKEGMSIIEFGKQNYQCISDLRHSIEVTIATDMLSLYDIEGFLKQKQSSSSAYRVLPFKAD